MDKKIKIFHANSSTGYSNWIPNRQIVDNIEDADLVLLEGGADVKPELYGQKAGSYTYCSPGADKREAYALEKALELGIPIWGTCKGLQHIAVAAGSTLVQDMDHPGSHKMRTIDGEIFPINSLHHQCINPYNLPKDEYEILGISDIKSEHHLDENDKDISNQIAEDIEAAYFPKVKGLAVQFHPEMMWNNNPESPMYQWLYKLIKEKLGLTVNY